MAHLSEATWDEFVPNGKEVDSIYRDFVLRNKHLVADPIPGRNTNMSVWEVEGAVIDLTEHDPQSD